MKVTIGIKSNIDNLTSEEAHQLAALLEKAGFTDVGIGGGEFDFQVELQAPSISISAS